MKKKVSVRVLSEKEKKKFKRKKIKKKTNDNAQDENNEKSFAWSVLSLYSASKSRDVWI